MVNRPIQVPAFVTAAANFGPAATFMPYSVQMPQLSSTDPGRLELNTPASMIGCLIPNNWVNGVENTDSDMSEKYKKERADVVSSFLLE